MSLCLQCLISTPHCGTAGTMLVLTQNQNQPAPCMAMPENRERLAPITFMQSGLGRNAEPGFKAVKGLLPHYSPRATRGWRVGRTVTLLRLPAGQQRWVTARCMLFKSSAAMFMVPWPLGSSRRHSAPQHSLWGDEAMHCPIAAQSLNSITKPSDQNARESPAQLSEASSSTSLSLA